MGTMVRETGTEEKVVLIVEDDKDILSHSGSLFRRAGWKPIEAISGEVAVRILCSGVHITMILLDLWLKDMDGLDVIRQVMESMNVDNHEIPPTVIVSGEIDSHHIDDILNLEIECVIPKPVDPRLLPQIFDAYYRQDERELMRLFDTLTEGRNLTKKIYEHENTRTYFFQKNEHNENMYSGRRTFSASPDARADLHKSVDAREEALLKYFKDSTQEVSPILSDEPLLIVARRWNSWYPSFFDVDGGSYVILGANAKDGVVRGTIIDPGFKAHAVLNSLKIPISCLGSCILTHNHPDHIGGIFEFFSARYTLDRKSTTNVFCTPSVQAMLTTYGHPTLGIKRFDNTTVDIIEGYTGDDDRFRRITATPVSTSHGNIGSIDDTKGIIFSSDIRNSYDFHTGSTAVIVGDTEYQCSENHPNAETFNKIRTALMRKDLKIAVLHIGSSQLKSNTGKHMYLPGLMDILKEVEVYRKSRIDNPQENKLLVLVSEWGLEHASRDQLKEIIPNLPGYLLNAFDNKNLMVETIEIIKKSFPFDTITLLPADIGLTVGIESGKIYTANRGAITPEEVLIGETSLGLTYS